MYSELPPKDVYRALSEKENSVLIDCRTRSEWVYVGIPDVSQTGRELALIEWVDSTGQPNPDFLAQCREKISADSSSLCDLPFRGAFCGCLYGTN